MTEQELIAADWNEPIRPVRRITEGPFYAVMLPDGTLLRQAADEHPLLCGNQEDFPDGCESRGRVVRVRSITYEVEVVDAGQSEG